MAGAGGVGVKVGTTAVAVGVEVGTLLVDVAVGTTSTGVSVGMDVAGIGVLHAMNANTLPIIKRIVLTNLALFFGMYRLYFLTIDGKHSK